MKAISLKTGKAIILTIVAVFLFNNVLSAQDWAGRRYSSEDAAACHEYIVKAITTTPEFKNEDVATRQTIMTVLSMTEMNLGIVFKGKQKMDMTIMMRLNQKIANAMNLDDETKAKFQSMLNELSSEMKESGVYSINGNTLTMISKDKEKIIFTILEDCKKLASDDVFDRIVFVRKK